MSQGTKTMDPVKTSGVQAQELDIATDLIVGGVADGFKVQQIKAGFGLDGKYENVSDDNPLPVEVEAQRNPRSTGEILEEILFQMKITNVHLAGLTGDEITENDILGD